MWDLSAAFDCLDINILCDKLLLYGFKNNSVKWFRSFFSNRSQRVKIGETISESIKLHSRVPQRGIISPLLYIIYVADLHLQLRLKFLNITSYADDTKTCVSNKLLAKVIQMLEEDANNVLEFMASNGLVANPSKTAFRILNHKPITDPQPISIRIGSLRIEAESSAKLLGVTLNSNQKWAIQIKGSGGTINSLNSRLYLLRRFK